MSHSRRSRPTLRLLKTDLHSGWSSPRPQRMLGEDRLEELHPLSELPHPIVAKAAESFGGEVETDSSQGLIKASDKVPLFEIKIQQWRGAVWVDPSSDVHWLIKAGLAKGDHKDSDDFYQQIERAAAADGISNWFPTDVDFRLLRQETAARILTDWELGIQRDIQVGFESVERGESTAIQVGHPVKHAVQLTRLTIEMTEVREDGYEADEILVEFTTDSRYKSSDLEWQAIIRALISLHPPSQTWDRYRDQFSTIALPGAWGERVAILAALNERGELAESEPGMHRHYSHRNHLAGSTVNGTGVRALCGVFLVSYQDHVPLPLCPECERRWSQLPTSH